MNNATSTTRTETNANAMLVNKNYAELLAAAQTYEIVKFKWAGPRPRSVRKHDEPLYHLFGTTVDFVLERERNDGNRIQVRGIVLGIHYKDPSTREIVQFIFQDIDTKIVFIGEYLAEMLAFKPAAVEHNKISA